MGNPAKPLGLVLIIGFFLTFTFASNFICPPMPLNESALCSDYFPFLNETVCVLQDYACSNSSVLDSLSDILVNMANCSFNESKPSQNIIYATLLFSKMNSSKINVEFGNLNNQINASQDWKTFFLKGIWPEITKNLTNAVSPSKWIPTNIQPFLVYANADMVTCLQLENVTCAAFQELVGNLNSVFNNMTDATRKQLYPALKSFLSNQKNLTGFACSQNTTSGMWINQNLGTFSQFLDFGDFAGLFANFSALDALPQLSIPQIASFSVDFNPKNNLTVIDNILARLPNANAVLQFLSSLNDSATQKNVSSINPSLAQALLNKTFDALKANFPSYTSSDWTLFFANLLKFTLPQITSDQLNIISPNLTCDTYQTVIKELNTRYQQLSTESPANIYKYFMKTFLSKQGPACSQLFNSSLLVNQMFGQFSQFADSADFLMLNSSFSAVDVLPLLTISQKVGFSQIVNYTGAATIVGSLQNANDVKDFLNQFNVAALQKNLTMVQAPLSQALLNKTFSFLLANTSSWNSSDWGQLFQKNLNLFLAEITPDELRLIPQNISCDSYQAVVMGLDSNFQKMTPGNQQNVFTTLIQPYLKNQGPACSPKISSGALLKQNFGQFSIYASYSDLVGLGGNFSAVDVLPLLTISQKVGFSQIANYTGAATIVGSLQNANDVKDFLNQFNVAALQKNLTMVQAPLSQALLNKTFSFLLANTSSWNSSDWGQLFQKNLNLFLAEITPDELRLIPQNISCDSYQAVVMGLDSNFQKMTPGNQQNVFTTLIQPYLKNQGPACSPKISSGALLKQNFGQFSIYASYSDLVGLGENFSAVDVLPLLTISQKVGFSQIANYTGAATIVGSLQNANDVKDFLNQFNVAALQKNLTMVQAPLSQALLNKTFSFLLANTSSWNSSDWGQLFQKNLNLFLAEITPDELRLIPQNISCDSYQAVVMGLDSNFQKMTPGNQQNVFTTLIQPYLKNQGPACSPKISSGALLKQNFGQFSIYASYSDLVGLGGNFSVSDVIPSLSIPQIASFTVDFNRTNNSIAINNILAALPNASAMLQYLPLLNSAATLQNVSSLPPALAQGLLNKTFDSLKANFSSYNSSGWTQFFQIQLSLLLPQITSDQLSLISPSISCDSFQAIVKGLDMKFQQMSPGNPASLYNSFIKPFLAKQGPSCGQNLNSSILISQNFGQFSQFANYSDFLALNSNFSALDVLPLLTLTQKVDASLSPNFTGAASIVGSLQNAKDVQDFLNQFNAGAAMKNLNLSMAPASLSQALLNKTFTLLLTNVSSWSNSDWSQLFQNKILMYLPEITPEQLKLIPQNISCDSYKTIVGSLNSNFQKMTPTNQQAIFNTLIQPYVTKQGPTCPQTGNSNALLNQFFGQFSKYANFSDLIGLGGNFNAADIVPSLTVPQLVDFIMNTTITPVNAPIIAANLKTPTDVYTFISSFKTAMAAKNQTVVNSALLSRALLDQIFQVLQPTFNNFNSINWTQLFNEQIITFLPNITPDQLKRIPKNIGCDSFQVLVKAMDSVFSQIAPANQQGIYKSFILAYLVKKDVSSNITCYNPSAVNSPAWLVTNMASFMTYTSEEDLTKCADFTTLQIFARDNSSMTLAGKLQLSPDAGLYYTSLLTYNSSMSITSLPDAFLCFLNSAALKTLSGDDALKLMPKINKQCLNKTSGDTAASPSSTDLQLATSLVGKLSNFTSDTITNLGQTAVGLSTGQINKISDSDLKSSVSSLASVSGWNTGQTRSIMDKLLKSNYTITNLTSLGSLVSGLPTKNLQALPQAALLSAAKDPQFVSKMSSAPPALKNQFVQQIIVNANTSSLVSNVPATLVSFIPVSKLFSSSAKLSLNDVNGKSWTASQASIFFDDLLLPTANYTDFSASVLQGFTCVSPNKIDNNQLKKLAQAMKTKNVALSEDQLPCMSRQVVKNGYPTDLDLYPRETLLYLNATTYSSATNATCTDFFTKVGSANVSVLQKGAALRTSLLSQALSCLNVTGFALTSAQCDVLGQLTCDLNSTYIDNSDSNLVVKMAQCKSFTSGQQTSLLKALIKGNSSLGSTSSWTKDTLNSLGAMSGFLTAEILSNISSISLKSWLKDAIPNKLLTRTQFATIIKNLPATTRARRDTSCTVGAITADNVNDDLLPVQYSAGQLDVCLSNDTLENYLDTLSSKAFTTEQLTVLKNKLDAIYPSGYPESILPSLGAIAIQCTDSDISKWNITSVDTLQGLLATGLPSSVATSVIGRYISSAGTLSSSAINIIGSNICLLTSAQLNLISANALGEAQPLDVSSCSQTVKDTLYSKAKTYTDGVTSDTSAYLNLMKPYLGGAPLADLKALASKNPNINVGTFETLNPSVVVGLTVSDVKNLLGNNTADLVSQVSNPVVNQWISSQKQSDLDTLGLGIQGGIRDSVTTTTAPTTVKSGSAPAFTQGLSFILTIVAAIFLF